MHRTALKRSLARILRAARYAQAKKCSAHDALAEVDRISAAHAGRRKFLLQAGAAAVAASLQRPAKLLAAQPSGSVAIIGAGLAGLACADALVAKGLLPTVYEASGRIGGRCWSLRNFFPGQVAERGGELIDTGHVTMRGYATRFGLTLESYEKQPGEVFYYFGGTRYSEATVVEEFRLFVEAMKDDLRNIGAPTATAFTESDRRYDLLSMARYLDTRGAGPLIKAVLNVAYTGEYGLATDRQSSLNLLLFIHADRRSKFMPFGVFSDERFHIVEGNDAIATGLAAALPQPVHLGHKLVRARKSASGRVALSFATGGRTLEREHDAVVFALPFSMLRLVELDASLGLPEWKLNAIRNLGYGTNSKMMVGFTARPWFTQFGGNGSAYSDQANLQDVWETNNAASLGARAVLTDYAGGALGVRLDPSKAQSEAALFLADLDRIFPGSARYAARDARNRYVVHVENWSRNPFSLGSYTCNQPGYFTSIADLEGVPVGNLFFAGEHTSSFYLWQGFMEGAALSGLTVASQVVTYLKGT